MINFRFNIDNPWSTDKFDNILVRNGDLSKNTSWELQFYKYSFTVAELGFSFSWRGRDHAGLKLDLGLFGYFACLHIYDNRHWDYENNGWSRLHEQR